MKIIKQRPDLLAKIFIPVIIALTVLYYTQPGYMHFAFYLNWIATAACMLLLVTPIGSTTLGEKQKFASMATRYSITWLIQILLCLTFLMLSHIINHSNNTSTINLYHLSHQYLMHYGLFPWTTYAITAIGLAWVAYKTEITATFSLATKLSEAQNDNAFSLTINTGARNVSFLTLGLTLTAITLLVTNLFYRGILHVNTGWEMPQIGIFLFCFVLYFIIIKRKILQKKWFKKMSLFQATLFFSLFLSLFIGLFFGLIEIINLKPIPTPAFIQKLFRQSWDVIWPLTATLWWLGWTPLISLKLARQCRGMSIRNSVMMLLSLPFISCLLLHIYFMPSNISSINQSLTSSMTLTWAGLVASALLLLLLTSNYNRHSVVNHTLPIEDKTKYRAFTQAHLNTLSYLLICLMFFLIGGCYLLNIVLIIIILPSALYPALLVIGNILKSKTA